MGQEINIDEVNKKKEARCSFLDYLAEEPAKKLEAFQHQRAIRTQRERRRKEPAGTRERPVRSCCCALAV